MTTVSDKGHVLVVDDEETVVVVVCGILEEAGYTTLQASSGEEALDIFSVSKVDMVITDIRMGGMDGFELMKRLKLIDKHLNVIVMTGYDSYDTVLKALQSGAYDYMQKPLENHTELLAAVDRACSSTKLIRQNVQLIHELESSHTQLSKANRGLVEANHKLKKLASTDTLTLLFNRRYFDQVLRREVDRRNRYKLPLTVVMIDIDHFKEINDTHGHEAGDNALRKVASIISDCARTADIVARYGGEEFVVILPQTDPENAVVFAERARSAVEEEDLELDDVKINLTISLGVAGTQGQGDATDPQTLTNVADKALYEAKAGGRNRYVRAPDINGKSTDSRKAA